MRPGQNRRMRGRNNNGNNNGNRKSPNPLQRSYESNGPDVKVRGTAQHVAEKYLQLARDAQSSGDTVAAESYFQHAEHYYRILLAAQEQMAQQFGHSFPPNRAFVEDADDGDEEGEEEAQPFQPGTGPQPDFRSANGQGAPMAIMAMAVSVPRARVERGSRRAASVLTARTAASVSTMTAASTARTAASAALIAMPKAARGRQAVMHRAPMRRVPTFRSPARARPRLLPSRLRASAVSSAVNVPSASVARVVSARSRAMRVRMSRPRCRPS